MSKAPAGVSAKWTSPASARRWIARELRPVTATASSVETSGSEHRLHRAAAGAAPGRLSVTRRVVSTTIFSLLFLFTEPHKLFKS